MSKDLEHILQPKKESEETSYQSPYFIPKVQAKTQPKVSSKIQPKLLTDIGKKKDPLNFSAVALPKEVQTKMENSFDHDFSQVTIHKDSSSAQDMNAKAYTQGSDIHFAPGEYNPHSKEGQELLGHELTHVVQQKQGKVAQNDVNGKDGTNSNSSLEKEADDAGKLASEGGQVMVSGSGNGVQKKEDEDSPTYENYLVRQGDTLTKITLDKFPYMKFDQELLNAKIKQIAADSGVDKDKLYAGKTILKIAYTSQEKINVNAPAPTFLKAADGEEKAVKNWSAQSGLPVQVIRGDKVKESEYKKQEHVGAQYFILHSQKTDGLQMNEAYSHNSKGDDGYFHKEEIAEGDYSKVPTVMVNGCESDENLDGFLKGGAAQAFGYFDKIDDELASEIGPQMLEQASHGNKQEMHQFTHQKMLYMKASGKIPIKYWSSLIDKYQEYSAEKYGVADNYELETKTLDWTDEKAKTIRKESRNNQYLKADRSALASINKEIRALQKRISRGELAGNMNAELERLEETRKSLQKQMLLQSQLKGGEGEKKTGAVQKMLNPEEAVVEIKPLEGEEGTHYIAMITTKDSAVPKVIYLPNIDKGVDGYLNSQSNVVKFNLDLPSLSQTNYKNIWEKIQLFLDSKNVKRIYYKASGGYTKININALLTNGKYLLEFLDVQYLY